MSAEDDYTLDPTLGELNTQLRLERGEVFREGDGPQYTLANDLRINRVVPDAEQGPTGINVPGYPGMVQSVYDARPANAVDFYRTSNTGNSEANAQEWVELTPPEDLLMEFTVPEGTVAVLRAIKWQFFIEKNVSPFSFPPPQDVSPVAPWIAIRINGIIQSPFRQDDALGANIGDGVFSGLSGFGGYWRDIYLPVESNAVVSIFVQHMLGDIAQISGYCEMTGQLLLSRGYPANFEPTI